MKFIIFTLFLSMVTSYGQEPGKDLRDTSVGSKRGEPKNVFQSIVPNPNAYQWTELEGPINGCQNKFGKKGETEENPKKLEQCAITAFKKFYLPSLKRLFPNYTSECEVDCSRTKPSAKEEMPH